jgi:bifunctional non-homologous end joining protein LigD
MPLEEYERKRSFEKTPEPKPAAPASLAGRVFCVQRHLARRLHYDLRIEIGGTLQSWAVPQGPTLDPTVKRLAVKVEDHPLEYATFEGNIPKGNYGAGSMMLWDTGGWELLGEQSVEDQIARGDFKFALHGQKLRGSFALVRLKSGGKGNDWLLLKKKDADSQAGWDTEQHAWSVKSGRTQDEIAADVPPHSAPSADTRAALSEPITPMLATLVSEPPTGAEWLYEVKWDGVRALCFITKGQVQVRSRKGTDITRQYPELSLLPHSIDAESAILDGEIAAVDEKGRPSFERIQPRIMASDANAIAKLAQSRPVTFFAFDLLYWNGRDLREFPLEERRKQLQRVVKSSSAVRVSETFSLDPKAFLEAVRAQGLEGIIAKRRTSPYRPGRSREWMKIKATRQQEFVICGYTHGERDYFGALVIGVYDGGELIFAGNVGTGFDQKMMKSLRELMDSLQTDTLPFAKAPVLLQPVQWLLPRLVCSVKFLEWTEDGRLRAPVFAGLRTDIDPQECTRTGADALPPVRPSLFQDAKDTATVTVDGHQMSFRNLNKVFYPAEGYTKRDVIEYYDGIADLLIPYWKDRPLSLRRYPDGITKDGFFQKHARAGFPDWMRLETIIAEDHKERLQVIGQGRAELIFLANLGCIDQNPWMSRVGSLDHPDFLLIDLDPHECKFSQIVEAALAVRSKLTALGLSGFPKTTGGDGMHIYVPLEPVYTYDQTRAFCEILCRLVAAERPDLFTIPRALGKREKGKVYFDYMQNARGKTISAPYVLRAYPGAPVATPLDWSEVVGSLDPRQFHIRNALARFAATGDLFAPVLTLQQRLEPAIERLEQKA